MNAEQSQEEVYSSMCIKTRVNHACRELQEYT